MKLNEFVEQISKSSSLLHGLLYIIYIYIYALIKNQAKYLLRVSLHGPNLCFLFGL